MLECTVTAFLKRARTLQLADAFMKIDSEGLISLIHSIIIRRGTSLLLHVNLALPDVVSFLVMFPRLFKEARFSQLPVFPCSMPAWFGCFPLFFRGICGGRQSV